jgi:nuclear pore complex protein Nup188
VLAPPTLDQTTPPSLGALTTCLSVGLDLLKKLEPHRGGTPSKSPSKSPRPLFISDQPRREVLCLMEHAVVLCVGQALCLLDDHTLPPHEQQILRKELANEMESFCHSLLLIFHRRGAPSPSTSSQAPPTAPPTSFQESWSGKSTLTFSETREQAVFRIADSFVKLCLP